MAKPRTDDPRTPRPAPEDERIRYDAQHRPVDRHGLVYDDLGPNPPEQGPETGADRHDPVRKGTLDPYHRDAPAENDPQSSQERPKAPAVHQATEDGRLYEPAREDEVRSASPKVNSER